MYGNLTAAGPAAACPEMQGAPLLLRSPCCCCCWLWPLGCGPSLPYAFFSSATLYAQVHARMCMKCLM